MKISTSWLPFEHLQVGGERRWVNLLANDSWIIRHCWVELKGKPTAQDEGEIQGPLEGITHHREGGCSSYHLSWLWRKWNKTLQDSNKAFLLSQKKRLARASAQNRNILPCITASRPCSPKDSRGCNKNDIWHAPGTGYPAWEKQREERA